MDQNQITGFVLAGGKSSRMGVDKAGVPLDGRTLLEHALSVIRPVCQQVFIIGQRSLYGSLGTVYDDIVPNCGPLGGIHAALTYSPTQLNLIIAVDTPFLTTDLLRYLVDRAKQASTMIVAPSIGGLVQPLCAVYSRSFLSVAEAALRSGNYKLAAQFPADQTLIISEADLGQFAFAAEMFENLNTPEDLERARKRSTGTSA